MRFKKGERRSPATEFKLGQHWRKHQPFRELAYLKVQYVEANRSASDIAREHGVTPAAVLFWLRRHGIARRSMAAVRAVKHWGAAGASNPMYGRVGELNPNWKGGCTPERQAFYASDEWRVVSRQVKRRDCRTCQRCGAEKATHIHHVVSFSVAELRATLSNLILLCEPCHDWVHSRANVNKDFIQVHGG